jgi:hypothetical protein
LLAGAGKGILGAAQSLDQAGREWAFGDRRDVFGNLQRSRAGFDQMLSGLALEWDKLVNGDAYDAGEVLGGVALGALPLARFFRGRWRSAIGARGGASFGSRSVGAAERLLNLGGGVRVGAATFHSRIKPAILNAAGKFRGRVGKNPDIKVVRGKIHLQGVGPFKGKTFKTDLRASDFFDLE